MTASLPRFALRTAIVLAGVCALGMWPISRWNPSQGVTAWGLAFALVFVGAVAGFLPMTTGFARRNHESRAQAWLIGLGLRMLIVLTGCLVVWSTGVLAPAPFLAGAGAGYAVILAIEIVSFARELPRATPSLDPSPKEP